MTPAAPANTDAMKNVNMITRSVSMPIIDAASRSNATARIAFPSFVRDTTSVSAIISAMLVRNHNKLDDGDRPAHHVEGGLEQGARFAGVRIAA